MIDFKNLQIKCDGHDYVDEFMDVSWALPEIDASRSINDQLREVGWIIIDNNHYCSAECAPPTTNSEQGHAAPAYAGDNQAHPAR